MTRVELHVLVPIKLCLPTVSVLPEALSSRNEYSAVALDGQYWSGRGGLVPYPFDSFR